VSTSAVVARLRRARRGRGEGAAGRGEALARLAARAAPLLAVYVAAGAVYGYQAWQHEVPWLFQDELFYASQARSYAETGETTIRGEPNADDSLTARITSIAWHFDDPETDYLAAKLLNVLLMAAACFPAYGIARLVAGRGWALFAAAGSVTIPAFAYTSMILTEPTAYLLSTTALWLIVRTLAFDRLRPRAVLCAGAAAGASLLAAEARDQLRILLAVLAVAGIARLLLSAPVRRRRLLAAAGWLGLACLCYLGYRREARVGTYLEVVDGYWSEIVQFAAWGSGALAIGLLVLPAVLGLASLWPDRERRREPGHVAFSLVAGTAVLATLFYTGVKGAYLFFTFGTIVVERNMIFVAPLLFAGTAIFLERRRASLPGVALALAAVTYAVYEVPYQLQARFYFDAPGLSILSTANRHLQWDDGSVRKWLAGMLALAAVVALAPLAVRNARARRLGACVLGSLMVAGTLTAEVAADRASKSFWAPLAENLPKPLDWVDEATSGERSVIIAAAVKDARGIWLTQFFNPGAWYLASVDATAPEPGPNVTLDIVDDDGHVAQTFPDAPYALVDNKLGVLGEVVRRTDTQTLYRIAPPLRLTHLAKYVSSDGWIEDTDGDGVAVGEYWQYSHADPGPGVVEVSTSRAGPPGKVEIVVSPVRWVGPHAFDQGEMVRGEPYAQLVVDIDTERPVRYRIPVPGPPFVVDVRAWPTFSPADFGGLDRRELGVQPGFEYVPGEGLDEIETEAG
jgi:hypothetical protein